MWKDTVVQFVQHCQYNLFNVAKVFLVQPSPLNLQLFNFLFRHWLEHRHNGMQIRFAYRYRGQRPVNYLQMYVFIKLPFSIRIVVIKTSLNGSTTLSASITGIHPAAKDSNRLVWTKRVVRAIKQNVPCVKICGYSCGTLPLQRTSFWITVESDARLLRSVAHFRRSRKLLLLSAMSCKVRLCRSFRLICDDIRKCGLNFSKLSKVQPYNIGALIPTYCYDFP